MKAIVEIEIEVDESIWYKYPNFAHNYDSESDFLYNEIASLNKSISIEETKCLINYHPKFLDSKHEIFDLGYKMKVLKIQEIHKNKEIK